MDTPAKGDITLMNFSVEHPLVPEIKGFIRGNAIISGYVFHALNNGQDSEVCMINQIDFKGDISQRIVNYGAEKAP